MPNPLEPTEAEIVLTEDLTSHRRRPGYYLACGFRIVNAGSEAESHLLGLLRDDLPLLVKSGPQKNGAILRIRRHQGELLQSNAFDVLSD